MKATAKLALILVLALCLPLFAACDFTNSQETETIVNDVIETAPVTETASETVSETVSETESATEVDVERVSINKSTLVLYYGDEEKLYAKVTGAEEGKDTVSWTYDGSSISVSEDGTVYGYGQGVSTVYATTPSGASASCTVVVVEKTGISISRPDRPYETEGETEGDYAYGFDYDGYEWRSNNQGVPNSTATKTVYIYGSGYVSFEVAVSSDSGDIFNVYYNGSNIYSTAGEGYYEYFSFYAYAGGELKFEYSKDAEHDGGSDTAYIRNLTIPAAETTTDEEPTESDPETDGYTFVWNGEAWVSNNQNSPNTSATKTVYAEMNGYITFYAKVSSEINYDFLRVYRNGVEQWSASGEGEYTYVYFYVNYGDEITFTYSKDNSVNGGSDSGYIRDIQYVYGEPSTEAETEGETGGGEDDYTFVWDGDAWVSNNQYVDYSVATMTIYAEATGYMFFDARVSSEAGCDILRVYRNGDLVWYASGEFGYDEVSFYVYYGDSITFEYEKDSSAHGGSDTAYIRNIRFAYDTESTTETETEIPSYEFEWNGEAWVSNNQYADGTSAIKTIYADRSGYISFYASVSSELNYDYFIVYRNGVAVWSASGELADEFVYFYVNYGDVVQFEYAKDVSGHNGTDTAYIKDIQYYDYEPSTETEADTDTETESGYTFEWDYDLDCWVSNNKYVDDSVASIEFTAETTGVQTVYVKVSSESGCDELRVLVNDVELFSVSGLYDDYVPVNIPFVIGETIRFEYSKDGSVYSGDDKAYFYVGGYVYDVDISGAESTVDIVTAYNIADDFDGASSSEGWYLIAGMLYYEESEGAYYLTQVDYSTYYVYGVVIPESVAESLAGIDDYTMVVVYGRISYDLSVAYERLQIVDATLVSVYMMP